MIKVFQADDHAIVREGMEALIAATPDMEFVGAASDGEEAVERVLALRPDVILLDLQMPKKSGIEALRDIKAVWPESKVLVITSFSSDRHLFPAIRAGALGYLLKDATPNEIQQAIRNVYLGQATLDPSIANRVLEEMMRSSDELPDNKPTERETEILKLIAQGYSNDEIGAQLTITERTVRTHVSNILAKLHLSNRTQAALYALREGIASLDER
jgi:NarL family two-component system response regulator LiaR